MKKNILFAVLAVAMLSFAGCNRNENPVCCEEHQGVITGILTSGIACPPDFKGDCILLAVLWVVNDNGIFALMGGDFDELRNFSVGDRITICATFVRAFENYSAYCFYHVKSFTIIR